MEEPVSYEFLETFSLGDNEFREFLRDKDFSVIERKEEIPEMATNQVVVIDTMYYSTTVVELLHKGVGEVKVVESKEKSLKLKKNNPELLAGGYRDENYEVKDDWDFFNSPTYVTDVAEKGQKAVMTSSNGAKAVLRTLENIDHEEILLGTTTNAKHVAEKIDDSRHITFISSGSQGTVSIEDHISIYTILKHLQKDKLDKDEKEHIRESVEKGRKRMYQDYDEFHERRRRDVEKVKEINSREVVPVLESDSFRDRS